MRTQFTIFGSCASRNIFNSIINDGYKNFFKINESVEGSNFISLMSKPTNIDENLINIQDKYNYSCFYNDISKQYLSTLKYNTAEYLIIDTYFEAMLGVIKLDENQFISDSSHLWKTKFYETIKDKNKINIKDNFEEYMYLWKSSCDKFFEYLKKNRPDIKVILNCSRSVYKYIDNDVLIEDQSLKGQTILNKYRDILDNYILDKFDVEILPFNYNTLAYKSHIFDLHSTHYEPKYYKEKTKQLNEIIERNSILGFNNEFNIKYRKKQRKKQILENNLNKIECSKLKFDKIIFYDKGLNYDYNPNWNNQLVNFQRSNNGTIVKSNMGNWFNPISNNNEYFLPPKFKFNIYLVYCSPLLRIIFMNSDGELIIKKLIDLDYEMNNIVKNTQLSIIFASNKIVYHINNKIKEEPIPFDSKQILIRFDLWGTEKLIFKEFSILKL